MHRDKPRPSGHDRARLESKIATLHRIAWEAGCLAGAIGDEGTEEDMERLCQWLSSVGTDLLRTRKRKPSLAI